MFGSAPSDDSFQSNDSRFSYNKKPDWAFAEVESELETEEDESVETNGKCIKVGDYLPCGPRLYYSLDLNIVRMKNIGKKHRILLLGVIGAFTPYCWNRHLFGVIKKARYYEERGIDYICCVGVNDAHTLVSWSEHLGCDDIILMLSDASGRFTKMMGMNTVIPWIDNRLRSKRYVIYAEDLEVRKIIYSPQDGPGMKYECEHELKGGIQEEEGDDDDLEDSDSESWF